MANIENISGLGWARSLSVQDSTIPEIIRLVESTRWADSLSGKEVETLARYVHVCGAEKDAVIVREAGREAYLCLIVEGRVNVVKEGKQISSAGPGRIVGEMSLIDGEPRSASIIAEDPTTLIILTGDGFSRLSTDYPRLAVKILLKISKLLSQRLRQTSGVLLDYLGG